jgi:hypothetical protein
MIDWYAKVRELKQMADELELLATRSQGRGRQVLGRIADELRQFAKDLHQLLTEPDTPTVSAEPLPDWLAAAGLAWPDSGAATSESGEAGITGDQWWEETGEWPSEGEEITYDSDQWQGQEPGGWYDEGNEAGYDSDQ